MMIGICEWKICNERIVKVEKNKIDLNVRHLTTERKKNEKSQTIKKFQHFLCFTEN